jgi:hypothetical protein
MGRWGLEEKDRAAYRKFLIQHDPDQMIKKAPSINYTLALEKLVSYFYKLITTQKGGKNGNGS